MGECVFFFPFFFFCRMHQLAVLLGDWPSHSSRGSSYSSSSGCCEHIAIRSLHLVKFLVHEGHFSLCGVLSLSCEC